MKIHLLRILTVVSVLASSNLVHAQLSGTYTIDPNGSGANNYTSFTSAIAALSGGVNGAVTFNVASGTYTEQIIVPSVTGANASNTITFQAAAGNTSPVVLTSGAATTTANYVVRMNAAKYVTLKGIEISSSSTTYGRVIDFLGASTRVTIQDCDLTSAYTLSSSTGALMYMTTTGTVDTLTITGCTFGTAAVAPYYATYFSATSTAASYGGHIEFSNNIVYSGYYGVYFSYLKTLNITGNTCTQVGTNTAGYGIRVYGQSTVASNWSISGNKVTLNSGGYGLYYYYGMGTSANPIKVYNNYIESLGGTSGLYALYIYYPTNAEIFNNTCRTRSSSTSNRAIQLYGSTSATSTYSCTVKNNIFANDVSGNPIYSYYISNLTIGKNIYYTPSGGLTGYYHNGTTHTSFSAYQTASGDATSVETDPVFISTDYHIEGLAANATADPVSYITVDLDGDTRSATPDIGADEFTPPNCATPNAISLSGVQTATALTLNWIGTSPLYEIEYGPTGFVQGTGTAVNSTDTIETLTVFANTSYDVYIRGNCTATGDGYSGWYGPVTFLTPCAVASLPYSEDFEGGSSLNCWSSVIESGTYNWYFNTQGTGISTSGVTTAHGGTKNAIRNYAYGTPAVPRYATKLVTPQLDITTVSQPRLEFWYANPTYTSYNENDIIYLYYRTHPNAQWNLFDSITDPANVWTRYRVALPNMSTTYQVGIEAISGYYIDHYGRGVGIDDILISETPLCADPTFNTLTVAGADAASVTYTRPAALPAGGFEIEIRTSGIAGSGSVGLVADSIVANSVDSVYFTGLPLGQTMKAYTRSLCANGELSEWAPSNDIFIFATIDSLPYSEDFNLNDGGWKAFGTNSSWEYGLPATANIAPYSGNAWVTNLDGTYNNNENSYLYSPYFDFTTLGVGEVSINFMLRHYNENNYDGSRLQMSVDGVNWILVDKTPVANSWYTNAANTYVNSRHWSGNNTNWAQKSIGIDTLSGYQRVQFRFNMSSDGIVYYDGTGIDNFEILPPPPCPAPMVAVDSLTDSLAVVSWTSGLNQSTSTLEWGPVGFVPGTGSGTLVVGATSPYTITGLVPNTSYDVYVWDTCTAGNGFSDMGYSLVTTLLAGTDIAPVSVGIALCPDSLGYFDVVVENAGRDTISQFNVSVDVLEVLSSNTTTFSAVTVSTPLAPNAVDTVTFGPLNTMLGGDYSFEVLTQAANDGNTQNDTLTEVHGVIPSQVQVSSTMDTVCVTEPFVTLGVAPNASYNHGWYASLTDTTMLAKGDSLQVSASGQQTYYVTALGSTADSAQTSLAGGNGSAGNMFNIINTSNAALKITGFSQGPGSGNSSVSGASMVVYYTPGSFTTQSAASWSMLASGTVNLTSGAATGYLPVSVTIPAGASYGFFVGLTSGSVQYTNGTGGAANGVTPWFTHPKFTITEGLGGTYPSPVNNPRNWNGMVHFGEDFDCLNTLRVPVSFAVDTDTAVAFFTESPVNAVFGQYSFDETGSFGTTFHWDFGDGFTFSGSNPVHTYAVNGSYTVTLTVTEPNCGTSHTFSKVINTSIGQFENGLNQVIRAFPNPSNGQVVVSISGTEAFEGSIQVVNGVGQILVNEPVAKQDGVVEIPMDLRNLPKGVYTIRLSGEQGESNLRVVLQ
jgi:hypothetical protein